MAFSRTWNAAYEAQPSDTENISLGASRIRNIKTDIQERGEVDHSWAGNADDGKHKQITFGPIPLTANPANLANHGFLYTKDVSAKAELHWIDEDGNVVVFTNAGNLASAFPAGTKLLFVQTSAPTGWTKDTDQNNKALRIVSGAAGAAGSTPFTTVFGSGKITGSHALSTSQIPAHTHTSAVFPSGRTVAIGPGATSSDSGSTGPTGGGGGHTHTLSLNIQYVDVIKATKD